MREVIEFSFRFRVTVSRLFNVSVFHFVVGQQEVGVRQKFLAVVADVAPGRVDEIPFLVPRAVKVKQDFVPGVSAEILTVA